jgi:predicted GIY-YIG superfamily endonuclease
MIAKIYRIIPTVEESDIGDVYFGSTTRDLRRRYNEHCQKYRAHKLGHYNFVTSFILFEKYGYENCKIEQVAELEYNSKEDFRKKEAEYIKYNLCVNDRSSVLDLERRRRYHLKHNKIWLSIKHSCCCGGKYSNRNKKQHQESKKHVQYLEEQNK